MTPSDFRKQLKEANSSSIPAILLFSGEEDFLAEEVFKAVAQSVDENFRSWDFVRNDLTDHPLLPVLEDAATMSFSGQRRFIIIDHPIFLTSKGSLDKQTEQRFLAYLQQPEAENTLVINAVGMDLDKRKKTVKLTTKNSETVQFERLSEKDTFKIVKQSLLKRQVAISDETINYYLRRLAFNLRLVMNNLNKLVLYGLSGKTINQETINALVTAELSESAFDLVTDINQGKMAQATQLYQDLLDRGEAPIRINALLQSQYRLLIQAKALSTSDASLVKQLKIHPYRAKLANQSASRQSMRQLADAYLNLAKIDLRLKSTTLDPTMLFEIFLSNNLMGSN